MTALPYLADCCTAIESEVWHCLTVRLTGALHTVKVRKVCGREWHSCCGKMVACLFCSADTIDKKEQSKYCHDRKRKHDGSNTKITMMIYLHYPNFLPLSMLSFSGQPFPFLASYLHG